MTNWQPNYLSINLHKFHGPERERESLEKLLKNHQIKITEENLKRLESAINEILEILRTNQLQQDFKDYTKIVDEIGYVGESVPLILLMAKDIVEMIIIIAIVDPSLLKNLIFRDIYNIIKAKIFKNRKITPEIEPKEELKYSKVLKAYEKIVETEDEEKITERIIELRTDYYG